MHIYHLYIIEPKTTLSTCDVFRNIAKGKKWILYRQYKARCALMYAVV